MKIIVQRRYAHLIDDLAKAFERNDDVTIWMDRRCGDRRSTGQPVLFDRRRIERRRGKNSLAEVVAYD